MLVFYLRKFEKLNIITVLNFLISKAKVLLVLLSTWNYKQVNLKVVLEVKNYDGFENVNLTIVETMLEKQQRFLEHRFCQTLTEIFNMCKFSVRSMECIGICTVLLDCCSISARFFAAIYNGVLNLDTCDKITVKTVITFNCIAF